MTASEQQIDRLYAKLRELLGADEANTLMTLAFNTEELARRIDVHAVAEDIAALRQRMDGLEQRMDGLEQRMDGLEQRMDGLEQRMDGLEQHMERMGNLMQTFDQRLWEFHEALRAQTRVFSMIVVTAVLGVGSMAFAAAALL